jgi:hypothetical protein
MYEICFETQKIVWQQLEKFNLSSSNTIRSQNISQNIKIISLNLLLGKKKS